MSLPDQIGRHRVQSLIGTGGFAVVVRAYDESLQDHVAIKILAEHWSTDQDIRDRFVEEARVLRRTRDPHLVSVHDIGELPDGRPYFVMEYANRGTLAHRIETRGATGLDAKSAHQLAMTLAGALTALHRLGVIHRDVNPRNLFISDQVEERQRTDRADAPTRVGGGLLGDTERVLLGDLGLAKDLVRTGSTASIIGGTPKYQAPEQVQPGGEVQPATDIYAATAVFWAAITGTAPPEPSELPDAVKTLEQRWRPWFERGMATDPQDRFTDAASWLDAIRETIGDQDLAPHAGARLGSARSSNTNPYQGLAAFQAEDAARFFGRDELVSQLLEKLSVNRVLVLGGASGSGKSSLIRAGLIPRLASGRLKGSDRWPIALFTPRTNPIEELAYQLERAARQATQRDQRTPGPTEISEDPLRARIAAEYSTDSAGGLVLVVDQFEELFTQTTSATTRQQFLEALSAIVDPLDSHVRLIIILRADFYAQSALYPWLAEQINRNQVLVGPMTRSELREAIEEPAKQLGLKVEEGLVDVVLDDAGGQAGGLPLVSHAMAETWRRRKGSMLSLEGYREAGGVASAIANTAEQVYEGLTDEEQLAARRLLLRMVSPGQGAADTRQSLPNDDLGGETDVARRVAAELTSARLLTVDREVISIAHEALIRSWPRLRHWIDENRDDLRTRQRISAAAAEWDRQERDPDLLYRGTPLSAALEWAAKNMEDLGQAGQDFLREGELAHDRELAALELEEDRSRRLRTRAIVVLGFLLTVAVVASVIGFTGFNQATQRLASGLATQASDLADEDPRLALALAVEAVTRGANTFEARDALVTATRHLDAAELAPARSPFEVGDAHQVAIHPSGEYFVVGTRQGEINIFDAMSGGIGAPLVGHTGAVEEIVFTSDGRRMITAGQDGAILVWDVSQPESVAEPAVLSQSATIIWGLAVSNDGSTVASAGENGVVQLWDIDTAAEIGAPMLDASRDVLSVQFSPDGNLLLAGNGRGQVMGWDLNDGGLAFPTFNAHESDLWEITFAPDGDLFATASSDGRIRVWDATGNLVAEPFKETTSNVRGVQFVADGTLLLAGDDEGHVRVWDLIAAVEVFVSQIGHGRQVLDSGLSADGTILATVGLDHRVMVWTAGAPSVQLAGHDGGAFGLAISQDGQVLATGDGAGSIRLFDPTTGETIVEELQVHDAAVWALAFSADGARIWSGDAGGQLAATGADTGESILAPQSAHDGPLRVLIAAGDIMFSGGDDGWIRAWDLTGSEVGEAMGPHAGAITGLSLEAGDTLVVSDRSGTISFWDTGTRQPSREAIKVEDNTVWGLDVSPNEDLLAAASDDWTVLVWDLRAGAQLASLTPHPDGATAAGFLGEGESLATSSRDGSVRLFDVSLGRELGALTGIHSGPVWRLVVFPDGVRYATSSEDGIVRIWDELDLDAACARAAGAFDEEQQRRYLGAAGEAEGCR